MRICLVVGHRKSSQGAVNKNQNITEFRYNNKLAAEISSLCKHTCFILHRDDNTDGYKNLPAKVNEFDCDLIISLHCNAFNSVARGHEVLYWNTSSKGKEYALKLNSSIQRALGTPDRGIKPKYPGDRGATILQKTKSPCVLLEPFFIDNCADYLNAINSNLAEEIANELNKM